MRGRASVEVAKRVLASRGLEVVGEGVRVEVGGVEVGEVDVLARGPGGELYAVEVKAGQASASDVKVLYVNALVLGARPVLVARACSEEAAALARRLGVEVHLLSDLLAVDAEELYETVRAAVGDAILELLSCLRALRSGEAARVLEAIASHGSLQEAAGALGLRAEELERRIGELRAAGLIPPLHGYRRLRLYAEAVLALRELLRR